MKTHLVVSAESTTLCGQRVVNVPHHLPVPTTKGAPLPLLSDGAPDYCKTCLVRAERRVQCATCVCYSRYTRKCRRHDYRGRGDDTCQYHTHEDEVRHG